MNTSGQIGEKPEEKFTFIDLFAGIGGFRIALESIGGRCVFSSEWDKYARITYEANFGEMPSGDITGIDAKSIPDHDILTAGFPCQPFSTAGKRDGFSNPQGNLFFDVARIIREKMPKAFILENVKNLIYHDGRKTLKMISHTLTQLGYSVSWKVIDASSYVPQHRERIIIVGFREDVYLDMEFGFTTRKENIAIKDILQETVPEKYTLSDHLWEYLQDYTDRHKTRGYGFGHTLIDIEKDTETRTLTAGYYKNGSEILIKQKGGNPRRLTPVECRRLMGFPETFIIPVSDSQAYRQFGNAVVPAVIRDVAVKVVSVIRPMIAD